MFKVLLKIIKNKKFTKFVAIVTLLILAFVISNSDSSFVQTLVYMTQYSLVRLILLIMASFLLSINIQIGLLFVIFVAVLINIPKVKENFENIPNMVDKGSILKYNKNFKEPKELRTEKEKKEFEKENDKNNKEEQEKEKEKKKKKKVKKGFAISEDYYHEKRGINNDDSEKNNVEEVNLDEEEDDTIEKELKRKFTNDLKKLEEYDSSSTDSSNSESSDSSTDSSDSEKEVEEVSMDKAREHMLKKLRNGIKKRYLND